MTCNPHPQPSPTIHDEFDGYGPPIQGDPCDEDCQNCAVRRELKEALNPTPPPD